MRETETLNLRLQVCVCSVPHDCVAKRWRSLQRFLTLSRISRCLSSQPEEDLFQAMRWLKSFGCFSHSLRFVRSRTVRPYLRDLYMRRLAQGPEPYRPRSAWFGWNGDAELSAFAHRINEEISNADLQKALIDRSYSSASKSLAEGAEVSSQESNAELALSGRELSRSYALSFLHHAYPRLPKEYMITVVDYLLADESLAYIASTLGLQDLVLYSDTEKAAVVNAPPSCQVLADSLLAVIGILAKNSYSRALLFIRDFVLTPLGDADLLSELIVFDKPMQLLSSVLEANNRSAPEPRLQWQAGMNTILACYQVGIYTDQELLGEAPGETIEIAEQEAARQALRNLFGIADHRPPLNLHGPLEPTELPEASRPNQSSSSYLT